MHIWKAKQEMETLKSLHGPLFGPDSGFKMVSSGTPPYSYILHYKKTLPASKATVNDFPQIRRVRTESILSPSPRAYVEIDDDVICTPRAKMVKLQEGFDEQREGIRKIDQYLRNGDIAAAAEEAALLCTVPFTEATALSMPISEPNEDAISNNLREQMQKKTTFL